FSSRRRHTRFSRDWSSDVCSSDLGDISCESLVVATGGLSIPTMGATGLGYEVAGQFGLPLKPRSAGLVPFTLSPTQLAIFAPCKIGRASCREREWGSEAAASARDT